MDNVILNCDEMLKASLSLTHCYDMYILWILISNMDENNCVQSIWDIPCAYGIRDNDMKDTIKRMEAENILTVDGSTAKINEKVVRCICLQKSNPILLTL